MSAVSTDDPDGGTSLSGRSTELQLEPPPTAGRGWHRLVEWSGTSPPVAALLLAGIVLGPHGIALLSAGTLALLAPAVPVGIGALGVLLGLSVAPGNADGRRVALPASVSVLVTLAIVGGGLMLAARAEYATLAPAVLVLVTGAAVCAATAPVLPAGHPLEPRSRKSARRSSACSCRFWPAAACWRGCRGHAGTGGAVDRGRRRSDRRAGAGGLAAPDGRVERNGRAGPDGVSPAAGRRGVGCPGDAGPARRGRRRLRMALRRRAAGHVPQP